jgi:hypothetical protein
MTPDSLSILLARDPEAIATEARRPPPRAVVAPFNLPKVIVQTECDETATLPLGVKARVSTPAPSPPRAARGAALVVAIPSPVAHGASTVRVVQVMANAGHAAAGWAGAVRALVWR